MDTILIFHNLMFSEFISLVNGYLYLLNYRYNVIVGSNELASLFQEIQSLVIHIPVKI